MPEDVYTGLEVTLLFDNDRVFVSNSTLPASLLDAGTGNALAGTMTLAIDFPVPLATATGSYVLELDLDLNQSVDVDTNTNEVYLEPTLLPRVNPGVLKEHAVGGSLRGVSVANDSFRIGLESDPGDPATVVTVSAVPGTVFQVDGVCKTGAAGLSDLDLLPANSWVQAFGTMDTDSNRFLALTVEAGTGSYNGGSDIVDGVVTGINGTELTVRGHSNNSAHTAFEFNLDYTVSTDPTDTKVVQRGSPTQYDTDELNVGTHVRMFGALGVGPGNPFDVTATTDVVRTEPSHIYGLALGAPASGQLTIDLQRVDLRDVNLFTWSEGGATPANPSSLVVDVGSLATGQGITVGTPVEAIGYFSAFSDAGSDFVASVVANRELTPSILVIRDRANGLTVTPASISGTSIDFTFSGTAAGREKAVVDQGFLGEADVTGTGVSVVPGVLGLGLYTIRDRTLHTISLYLTFGAFAQGLEDALGGGATLFNFTSVGIYDGDTQEITSTLTGVVVQ